MKFPLVFDATISRDEFLRLLPAATGEECIDESADGFVGKGWRLRIAALPPLAIGLIHLQRHRMEISFDGMSVADQDRFMRRFSLHFQRGGG